MYDLEEQEKIDALKDWWKRNRTTVLTAVAVFLIVFSAVQGWRYYQRTQADQAAALFEALKSIDRQGDANKTLAAARELIDRYPGSAYAPRAALLAARASSVSGDTAAARSELEWVIAHAKELQLRAVARLRLAGILADAKQYDEALKLLDGIDDPSFAGLRDTLRGDVFAREGRAAEASAAYRAALGAPQLSGAMKQLTEIKLDALGSAR
jgi:predicted negative regulator of RcsB-dependent stress response